MNLQGCMSDYHTLKSYYIAALLYTPCSLVTQKKENKEENYFYCLNLSLSLSLVFQSFTKTLSLLCSALHWVEKLTLKNKSGIDKLKANKQGWQLTAAVWTDSKTGRDVHQRPHCHRCCDGQLVIMYSAFYFIPIIQYV